MISLTNKQAAALLSQTANELFTDPTRSFPVKDSFLILSVVQEVESKVKLFREKTREIILNNNGKFAESGDITFDDIEDKLKAEKEIDCLSAVKLDYAGDLIEVKDDWPKLSIQEAMILKPLIVG